jgi:hypothetical protein
MHIFSNLLPVVFFKHTENHKNQSDALFLCVMLRLLKDFNKGNAFRFPELTTTFGFFRIKEEQIIFCTEKSSPLVQRRLIFFNLATL